MQSRSQNRLVIGAMVLATLVLVCVIFGTLAFLTVNQISLSANVANLSASLAAQENNESTYAPRDIVATGRGDLRGTFAARRPIPTP